MIKKIESQNGYVFVLKDKTAVYENIIYLGIYDSEDNYIEVTLEEARKIKAKIQENEEKLRNIASVD